MENEKRLIDANALMKNGWHLERTGESNRFLQSMSLADVPTIDAVEVVHGEWTIIEDDYSFLTTLRCSVCGEEYCFEEYDEDLPPHYRYCPNCGAKMDLKGE